MYDEKHTITLINRENMNITGVSEVLSFDDENAVLDTLGGVLFIKGNNIQMAKLDLTSGEVEINGFISNLAYSDQQAPQKGWLIGKIFK